MNLTALQDELVKTRRTSKWINISLWGIAAGVMAYGAGYVTELLLAHGAPPLTAWLLSFMVDLGLCVALLADRRLAQRARRGWRLTALRWTCAGMTWALNVAGAVWPAHGGAVDWVGVGVRSCGPVLLVVVAEAAVWVQQQLADDAAELCAGIAAAEVAAAHESAVAEAWDAAHREDRKRAATTPPQTAVQPRPQPQPARARKSAARPNRQTVLTELVDAARTNPASLPTAVELASQSGYSKRWADDVLAEARREAGKPRLVEAAR